IRDRTVTGVQTCALPISLLTGCGDLRNANNLNLSVLDPRGTPQPVNNALNAPGLTGRRQRAIVNGPGGGTWTARVQTAAGSTPEIGRASRRERGQRWVVE